MSGIRYYFNHTSEKMQIKKCEDSLHASKAHFHHQISIGFVERGSCMLEVYDKTYHIIENTMLIIPANIVHKCSPKDHSHWRFKMLYIDTLWFQSAFNKDNKDLSFLYQQIDERLYQMFACLFDPTYIAAKDMGYESILVESILNLLDLGNENFYKISGQDQHISHIECVKAYLDTNYLNPVMLEDISELVHLSKYYIIRQFQQLYGLSPYQYLVNLRINRAKELLNEQKEIIEAALQTGFYDQSHFTKCFKQYMGLTPMQYRNYVK
ncbi:AraC family transcriptional regulator [Cellulosilyticum sp. I15G10I2]|uniref:AraC family transcriptional regulator n=1 Tax=Cellulosilyticum sp. I15G10I2 TaxID=1892843 RepID=UPI00085C2A88|nr:AraC family transcriptional regulator [Cellulosilyticum sp. I15G10I2]